MRKAILWSVVASFVWLLVVAAIAAGVQSADAIGGTTITIDGETFSGTALAGVVGYGVALGIVAAGLLVVAVLASVVVVVPLALVFAAVVTSLGLFVGLLPILGPLLLLGGAYVLLSRRTKRPAATDAAPTSPPAPTIS